MKSIADQLGTLPPPRTPEDVEHVELPTDVTSVKEFCQQILASAAYRDSLRRRLVLDALPPAIEALFYHYAFGKPADRVEHTGRDGQPIETITEVRRVIVRSEHDTVKRMLGEDAPRDKKTVTH